MDSTTHLQQPSASHSREASTATSTATSQPEAGRSYSHSHSHSHSRNPSTSSDPHARPLPQPPPPPPPNHLPYTQHLRSANDHSQLDNKDEADAEEEIDVDVDELEEEEKYDNFDEEEGYEQDGDETDDGGRRRRCVPLPLGPVGQGEGEARTPAQRYAEQERRTRLRRDIQLEEGEGEEAGTHYAPADADAPNAAELVQRYHPSHHHHHHQQQHQQQQPAYQPIPPHLLPLPPAPHHPHHLPPHLQSQSQSQPHPPSPSASPQLLATDQPPSTTHDSKSRQAAMLDQRRRRALLDLDEATFSKFHVRTVLVAGAGFFTDAYDIFAISVGSVMLGLVYANGRTSLGSGADLALKVATPIGNLFGQTLFGWMADVYGRKKMYGVELVIIITATLVQATAAQGPNTSVTITGVLVFWRFIMGVGIGGDYPLSAIITSEFAATRIRGRMMTAVFSAQGLGTLTATVIAVICVAAFRTQIESSGAAGVDPCWRLLIGLGCVPAVFALYFRLSIPESPRFTMDVERNVLAAAAESEQFMRTAAYRDDARRSREDQLTAERDRDPLAVALRAEAPRMSWADFKQYFGEWRNGKILFGTAYSWFALDIAFYGLGFNSSILLNKIGYGIQGKSCVPGQSTSNPNDCMYTTVWSISVGSVILAAAGLIPGFIASFFLVDLVGRRPLQLAGFLLMTLLLSAMGFAYWALQGHASAFVALFCLANLVANAGPNTTTFVIPGEVFPTRYRSTAHGISAASGKLGAVIAQIIFSRLQDVGGAPGDGNWIGHILEIFAFFMLTGVFSTLLLPETKCKSLEELSNENQENFIYDMHEVRLPDAPGGVLLHGQPEMQGVYALPNGNGHGQGMYVQQENGWYGSDAGSVPIASGAVLHDTSVYARGHS